MKFRRKGRTVALVFHQVGLCLCKLICVFGVAFFFENKPYCTHDQKVQEVNF